jgi:hypothetical protein
MRWRRYAVTVDFVLPFEEQAATLEKARLNVDK